MCMHGCMYVCMHRWIYVSMYLCIIYESIYVICMYLYKHVILEYQPMVKALWYIQDVFLVPGDGHLDTQWWYDFCGMVTWRRAFLFKAQKPAMCFPPANSQLLSDTSRWFSQHLRMTLRKQGSNSSFFDFVGMARKTTSQAKRHSMNLRKSRLGTPLGMDLDSLIYIYIYISKIPGAFWLSSSCWCGHAHFYWSLHSHDFTFNLSNLTGWISYKAIQEAIQTATLQKLHPKSFASKIPDVFFFWKLGKIISKKPIHLPWSWSWLAETQMHFQELHQDPEGFFKGGFAHQKPAEILIILPTILRDEEWLKPGVADFADTWTPQKVQQKVAYLCQVLLEYVFTVYVEKWWKMSGFKRGHLHPISYLYSCFLKENEMNMGRISESIIKGLIFSPWTTLPSKKKRWENWLRPFGTWHQINKNVLGIIPKYPPLNLKRTGPLVPPSPKNPPQPFWWNQNDNL